MLLVIASGAVFAQSPASGSLTGKLTDLHSRPLDGATLILRDPSGRIAVQTVTKGNGTYRFSGLPAGEYTLEAESPLLGRGTLHGIVVSADHEARMQAAMRLDRQADQPVVAASRVKEFTTPSPLAANPPQHLELQHVSGALRDTASNPTKPLTASAKLENPLAAVPIETLPLRGSATAITLKAPPVASAFSQTAIRAETTPAAAPVTTSAPQRQPAQELAHLAGPVLRIDMPAGSHSASIAGALAAAHLQPPAMLRSGTAVALTAAMAALNLSQAESFTQRILAESKSLDASDAVTTSITGEQLQALPLAGRRWENFALDSPAPVAAAQTDELPRESSTAVTVDGSSTSLAFGAPDSSRAGGASLLGPGSNEAAIREVRVDDSAGNFDAITGSHTNLETRRGSKALHGQAFLFERQSLWGAKNPFTQWVQETAPATLTTTPVFTPHSLSRPIGKAGGDSPWADPSYAIACSGSRPSMPASGIIREFRASSTTTTSSRSRRTTRCRC